MFVKGGRSVGFSSFDYFVQRLYYNFSIFYSENIVFKLCCNLLNILRKLKSALIITCIISIKLINALN